MGCYSCQFGHGARWRFGEVADEHELELSGRHQPGDASDDRHDVDLIALNGQDGTDHGNGRCELLRHPGTFVISSKSRSGADMNRSLPPSAQPSFPHLRRPQSSTLQSRSEQPTSSTTSRRPTGTKKCSSSPTARVLTMSLSAVEQVRALFKIVELVPANKPQAL